MTMKTDRQHKYGVTGLLRRSRQLVCLACLYAATVQAQIPEALAPTLILHDARLVTVDADFAIDQAMAIRNDRILAVGSNDDILALRGPSTTVLDLNGRTVIPGLIDSHVHALGYGMHITRHVMFSTGERLTVAGMLQTIKEHAAATSPGEWIYSRGPYSLDFVAEHRLPTRQELDRVVPDHPFFMNMQGHVGVVNSRAIELSGVTRDTPDPPNGVFVRDPVSGELTGTLYEFPAFVPFLQRMPADSDADLKAAVLAANEVFLAHGLTTVVNLWMTERELRILKELARDDRLRVRWATMLKTDPARFAGQSPAEVEQTVLALGPPTRFGNDWLTVNGLKIIYDGFAEAALMHQPYLEKEFGQGWKGIAFWDKPMLENVLRAAARHGLQVSVHVAGDAALDDVLEVMRNVNRDLPLAGLRWTLEHVSVLPDEKDLDTARQLQLIASTQQSMGWSIGRTFKEYWGEERGGTFAPNRTWLQGLGHPFVKAGSDNRPINPFIGFWAYLSREDVDGKVAHLDEALSRQDTLRLYTANGAYGLFAEDQRGTIETGKLADLVVLSADILSVPERDVRDIEATMTIVGGRIMYRQP